MVHWIESDHFLFLSLKDFIFFLFVSVCVYLCLHVCNALEGQKKVSVAPKLELHVVESCLIWVLSTKHVRSLEEQQELLTTKPSLQPFASFFY